jgi:hypothetical protein
MVNVSSGGVKIYDRHRLNVTVFLQDSSLHKATATQVRIELYIEVTGSLAHYVTQILFEKYGRQRERQPQRREKEKESSSSGSDCTKKEEEGARKCCQNSDRSVRLDHDFLEYFRQLEMQFDSMSNILLIGLMLWC